MDDVFRLERRDGALLLSMPHVGTEVSPGLEGRLTEAGRGLGDTDWHVDRLYDFAAELDATVLRARFSRTVIDLNRDPGGASLYPGQATTALCPVETFDGLALYAPGQAPDAAEIEERTARYHAPYHDALAAEIERVRARHGYVLLYDCHSIRSVIPRLFDGELPALNLGSNDGASCDPALAAAALDVCAGQSGYAHVLNGRFKGGWITRHYGRPAERCHALQMELAQRVYMEERPPWRYREDLAAAVRPVLREVLERLVETARRLG